MNKKHPQDVFGSIVNYIGESMSDIRGKLIEQPWFGKELDTQATPSEHSNTQNNSRVTLNSFTYSPTVSPEKSPYAQHGLPASFDQYRDSKDAQPPQNEKTQENEVER